MSYYRQFKVVKCYQSTKCHFEMFIFSNNVGFLFHVLINIEDTYLVNIYEQYESYVK